jgi:Methyltransferase domain
MHRFWTLVIEPIIDAVRPRVIVEVGVDRGRNTARLLEYCRRAGAVAHIIDPDPKFSVAEWQEDWPEAVFHRELSLEALPSVGAMDLALVDGDHNWYTVFGELEAIAESTATEAGFPVTLLHDVDWPYGRRDSYYDLASIPARHRHPAARRGLRPGKSELAAKGGLNAQFEHALHEGGARNGVLTAVEDFVAQSDIDFRLVTVPGFHGLAILAPASLLARNRRLAELVTSFETPDFLRRQCDEIERARLRSILRARAKRKLLKERIRELEAGSTAESGLARRRG